MRLLPKLVLLMTAVAAVPLGLAGTNAIRISQEVTRTQVREAHLRLAENLAESVHRFVLESVQNLSVSGRTFPFETLSAEERRAALKVLFFQMPAVDALALVDESGQDLVDPVAVSPGETPPEALRSRAARGADAFTVFRARLPLAAALDSGAAASPLYGAGGARGPHVAIAVKLGEGQVLAAEISLDKIRGLIDGFRIGMRGEAFLLDGDGRIAVHKDGGRTGEDLSAQPFFSERLTSVPRLAAAGEYTDAAGERWISAFAPVGQRMDWGVAVAQPERDAFVASRSLRDQTILWIGASLLFAGVLAVFYAREVGRPVEEAAEGARRFADGDLDHRMEVRTRDEVGELVAAFNDMAGKLQASMNEISRQNSELEVWNTTLQEKVEARTRELREAQAQLVQSKKLAAMGELGAGVAHELNNPLAGIKGFAQLLLMSRKPEDKEFKQLKTIEEQALRCSEIITRLLRFSQEAAAQDRVAVDLNELVTESLSMMEGRFRESKVEIHLELASDLPKLTAIPGELREVCWHVLSNARNAMPAGGRLEVTSWKEDGGEKGEVVKLSFADTGKGIAPEIADRIFEPFFTTKDEWKGTGLGLAVVHRIVTDHGGTVEVRTSAPTGAEEGRAAGATFVLVFPLRALPASSPAASVAAPRPKTQLV